MEHMLIVQTRPAVATTEEAKGVIWKYMELRLDCLAARAIKGHDVRYRGVIPPSLQNFVELHLPLIDQRNMTSAVYNGLYARNQMK